MSRDLQSALRPQRHRWLSRLVNVVGVALVTLLIIWAVDFSPVEWWKQWRDHQPIGVKAPSLPPAIAIGLAPPAPKGNDSSVSKVPLPLILVQVYPGRTVHEGTAQIGVVEESPQTYQAGALLENGATLTEIYPDHVVLEKEGRLVRLYLGYANQSPRTDSAMVRVGGVVPAATAAITSREIITDYLRPNPVYSGDTLVGYELYPGSNPGPFYQMGLQPGDVLTEIGGTALLEPIGAWELMRQLAEGASLSASVKRDGVLQAMTLDGSLITSAEEAKLQQPPQAMLTANPR